MLLKKKRRLSKRNSFLERSYIYACVGQPFVHSNGQLNWHGGWAGGRHTAAPASRCRATPAESDAIRKQSDTKEESRQNMKRAQAESKKILQQNITVEIDRYKFTTGLLMWKHPGIIRIRTECITCIHDIQHIVYDINTMDVWVATSHLFALLLCTDGHKAVWAGFK